MPGPYRSADRKSRAAAGACCVVACLLVLSHDAQAVEVLEDTIEQQVVSNGAFDAGLEPWTFWTASLPNPDAFLAWSLLDADLDPASGSAQFVNLVASAGTTYASSPDCFQLGGFDRAIRVRLRYHVASGSARLSVPLWSGFEGDTPEVDPPCRGPGIEQVLGGPVAATAGFVEFDSGWLPAVGPLASLDIGFTPQVPLVPYVAHIDDVRVDVARMSTVFEDGLESR